MDLFNCSVVPSQREGIKIRKRDFFRLPADMKKITPDGLMVLTSDSKRQIFVPAIIVN